MMLRHVWPLAFVGLAGCYSLEDVRQKPVVWEATYGAQFDTMANCLSGFYASEYSVVPQLHQREQRASIVLTTMPSGSVVADIQVRQLDATRVEVSMRRAHGRAGDLTPFDRTAQGRAERCARGG